MSNKINRVIMENALFYATDALGNADQKQDTGHGLYMNDTRFLSHCELRINGERPELLGSSTTESYLLSTLLKYEIKDTGAVEIKRSSLIYNNKLHEQLQLNNFFLTEQTIQLSLRLDADFQDMFLVRRYRTGKVGNRLETVYSERNMCLQYAGKDEQLRQTYIYWSGNPQVDKQEQMLEYKLKLKPGQLEQIELVIVPKQLPAKRAQQQATDRKSEVKQAEQQAADRKSNAKQMLHNDAAQSQAEYEQDTPLTFAQALNKLQLSYSKWLSNHTQVSSSSPLLNSLYKRSMQDLRMLRRDIGYGATTVAGLPWFATVFGRDSLITSLFMLPIHPDLALGTLRTLAAYQGKADDPWRDEERGKIMHEIRFGELVQTGQSPFGPYYGGVDSTPLFLVLLVEYVKWSGDTSIVKELEKAIDEALQWIDRRCRSNEAGFLTYKQEAEQGFPNQGWKDSANSIVNEAGTLASAPIALIEVQGYISYAKQGLAEIMESLGKHERGELLKRQAEQMTRQIERYFWMEDEQYFSIALDGELKPVRSVTSNAAHLLLLDQLHAPYAERIADRVLSDDMFNGWGIRTMSSHATGYYPMSYHNGSVWPHDNGMILLGCIRNGLFKQARVIVTGLLEAAGQIPQQRFPELFCGYSRDEYDTLIPYPTTCSPQAWSGATTFIMLQAMLGLQVNVLRGEITISPALPKEIQELKVTGITIGTGTLDLYVQYNPQNDKSEATILSNTTGLEISIT